MFVAVSSLSIIWYTSVPHFAVVVPFATSRVRLLSGYFNCSEFLVPREYRSSALRYSVPAFLFII